MKSLINGGSAEAARKMILEPSLPGLILATLGLMYLGKISGSYLKEKIGKLNTIKLALVGLVAGALTATGAMLYESLPLVWTAGAIISFSTGMSISTDINKKIKK